MRRAKAPHLYILEVQLRGALLPVWRIIEVEKSITMHELHATIQIVMGWESSHLYEFSIGTRHYIDYHTNEPFEDGEYLNSRDTKLSSVIANIGDQMTYLYDYGDYWEHDVILKGLSNQTQSFVRESPALLGGAMHCPPEDIGGIMNYNEIVAWKLGKAIPQNEDYITYFKDYDIFKVDIIGCTFLRKQVKRLIRTMDQP